jgi:hypothetical protein
MLGAKLKGASTRHKAAARRITGEAGQPPFAAILAVSRLV